MKKPGTILATLCYVRHEGKTLMLYRNKKANDFHEGKYNGLGGKFEAGETPEECVIREIEEESGLIIRNPKLEGIIDFPLFDQKNDWYVFIFTATEFAGELITSPEGHLEWIEDSNLFNLNLWDGDQHFLKWIYMENRGFFSAKFQYENKRLIDYDAVFYP